MTPKFLVPAELVQGLPAERGKILDPLFQFPTGEGSLLLHAVHLGISQALFNFSGQLGKVRDLRPGGGDIIADLIIPLPGLSAVKIDSPPDSSGIIKNRGSLVLLLLLENIEIIVGAIAEPAGMGQGRDIQSRLAKQLLLSYLQRECHRSLAPLSINH